LQIIETVIEYFGYLVALSGSRKSAFAIIAGPNP
jgi:hypothetical protein